MVKGNGGGTAAAAAPNAETSIAMATNARLAFGVNARIAAGDAKPMDDPLHRCAAALKCLARTSDGAAATMKPQTLCKACLADVDRCVRDLPAINGALASFVAVPIAGGGGGVRVAASKEPPSPMNARIVDLRNTIAEVILEISNVPARDFITWDNGLELAAKVRKLFDQADKIIGLSVTWERKGAPCRECGAFAVGGWAGSDHFSCTACGSGITRNEYETQSILKAK